MKVKELIDKLKEVDPDLEVMVNGYEGGFNYAYFDSTIINYKKDVYTEWYMGRHERANQNEESDFKGVLIK